MRTILKTLGSVLLCAWGLLAAAQEPGGPGPRAAPAGIPGYAHDGPIEGREMAPDPDRPDEPPRFDKGGPGEAERLPATFLGDPYFLGFAGGVHRPPEGETLDPLLAIRIATGPRSGEDPSHTYAYVMFRGRITAERMDRVEALGVKLLHYHPNNCWAARIPVETAVAVSELAEVRWVGFARPEQKVHPALRLGILSGEAMGAGSPASVRVFINLFECDLNAASVKVPLAIPVETGPGEPPRPGNPEAAAWTWRTNGRIQHELERPGVEILDYREEIRAYEAAIEPSVLAALASLDYVSFIEWARRPSPGHDRVVPQTSQDYEREITRVTTQTVGVIDTGFHLANGGFNGHLDLDKQAVGWLFWTGCGSVFCDEPPNYHGTHVLGTIAGSGTVNPAYRGTSPYLGTGPVTNHRLFLAKCTCDGAFQVMRNPYTDGNGQTTPRPVIVSNSWGNYGCISGVPATFIGSEAGPRTVDAEVFNQNQLYLFCAGNEGDCGGACNGVAGTIRDYGTAKNALTVGMVNDDTLGSSGTVLCHSSRGPCGDGRWKPNIVAPGCWTTSTEGGTTNQYIGKCGCSMATPAAAGILAGVAETYLNFRNSSALARAWAMGTAVTWQDTSATGSWGSLPSSHLTSYGMGRISALKALRGDVGLPWARSVGSGNVTASTITFDVTVEPGTTRLVVVLTWNDPPAAAGANPAVVKDVDLWVDREPFTPGNSGEYWSRTTIDTVEHVVVNDPPPGSYRIKVEPYNTTGTVAFGLMVVRLFGDTTPSGSVQVDVSDSYLRPGDTTLVTLTPTVDSYLATNLVAREGTHPGLARVATAMTLKDGVLLLDRHDAYGNLFLGDILFSDLRSASYTFRALPGDMVSTVEFTFHSDNWGNRLRAFPITIDGTPPPRPTNLQSTTHTTGQWSSNRTITFTWVQPPDNLSGVGGYAEGVAEGSPVTVPTVQSFGVTTTRTLTLSSDYSSLYYGLRAFDLCDNYSGVTEAGPFGIDTVPPGVVTNLVSSTHSPGMWYRDPQITFFWDPAPDDRSGLDGYGLSLTVGTPVVPPQNRNLGAVTTFTATLSSSASGQYFNIRAVDRAGNWSTRFENTGPYFIDALAPTGPSNLRSPTHVVGSWSSQGSITTEWNPAQDPHSGLAGYVSSWDQSPSTEPTGFPNLPPEATSLTTSVSSSAGGWFFHLRARDQAGNLGATQHLGPFYIDTEAPLGPTNLASPTHTTNVWSNLATVTTTWTAATDAHSGLAGYSASWDQNPGTNPPGTRTLPASATSEIRTLSGSAAGWHYHIRAVDNAGNLGATRHLGPFLIDTSPPQGVSLLINGGSPETPSLDVALTITASDPHSGVDAMRFLNDGGVFSPWEPYAASRAWNLTLHGGTSATGTRSVTVEVRDRAGNSSPAPATIYLYVPVTYFGNACSGSLGVPVLAVSGVPGIGRTLTFSVGPTAAPLGILYMGLSNTSWNGLQLPLELGLYGVPGCYVNASLEAPLWQGPPIPVPIAVPAEPSLAGLVTYWQWVLLGDPSGRLAVTTRAARVTLSGS